MGVRSAGLGLPLGLGLGLGSGFGDEAALGALQKAYGGVRMSEFVPV